jgi:hypothetical protein
MEDTSIEGRPGANGSFAALALIGGLLAIYANVSLLLAPFPSPTRDFAWGPIVANLIAFPCLAAAMCLLPRTRAYSQIPATMRWVRWMGIAGLIAAFVRTIESAIAAAT